MLILLLSGCAHQNPSQVDTSQPVDPKIVCASIDVCTYGGSFNMVPIFNCKSTTYQKVDHPELNSDLFQGLTCLTTKEDYHTENQQCGPNFQFVCQVEVQGPGVKAIQ